MKKIIFAGCFALMLFVGTLEARAQGGAATKGPDPTVVGDAELEKEAKHNLEVAKHYFKLKKAYRAALTRAEEIVAGYPNFSRMDYALYIAGMSNLYLAEGKGKQKSDVPADKLREEARMYLSRIVNEFPDSDFRRSADEELRKLGGAKSKEEATPQVMKLIIEPGTIYVDQNRFEEISRFSVKVPGLNPTITEILAVVRKEAPMPAQLERIRPHLYLGHPETGQRLDGSKTAADYQLKSGTILRLLSDAR